MIGRLTEHQQCRELALLNQPCYIWQEVVQREELLGWCVLCSFRPVPYSALLLECYHVMATCLDSGMIAEGMDDCSNADHLTCMLRSPLAAVLRCRRHGPALRQPTSSVCCPAITSVNFRHVWLPLLFCKRQTSQLGQHPWLPVESALAHTQRNAPLLGQHPQH
jgi:hypothetical protein